MKTAALALLGMLGMLALLGCQQRPPTAQELQDQQRFMMGCRPVDAARDPTDFEAYCDQF